MKVGATRHPTSCCRDNNSFISGDRFLGDSLYHSSMHQVPISSYLLFYSIIIRFYFLSQGSCIFKLFNILEANRQTNPASLTYRSSFLFSTCMVSPKSVIRRSQRQACLCHCLRLQKTTRFLSHLLECRLLPFLQTRTQNFTTHTTGPLTSMRYSNRPKSSLNCKNTSTDIPSIDMLATAFIRSMTAFAPILGRLPHLTSLSSSSNNSPGCAPTTKCFSNRWQFSKGSKKSQTGFYKSIRRKLEP